MRRMLGTIGLAASLLVGGCAREIEFERQTITIRHDPESDAVDVRLVYRGLFTRLPPSLTDDDAKRLEAAASTIERLAKGSREFCVADGGSWVPLDEPTDRDASQIDGATTDDPQRALRREITSFVRLVDHAAFVDDELRLCFVQRFEIRPWSRFEQRTNEWIGRLAIAHDEEARSSTNPHPEGCDPKGHSIRLAKAHAKTPWFAIRDNRLELDLAMSHEEYTNWVRLTLDAHIGIVAPGFVSLVSAVLTQSRRVVHDEGGLELTVGDGTWPLRCDVRSRINEYDHRLCESVRARGIELRTEADLADLLGDK